jgi:hypothetical protein
MLLKKIFHVIDIKLINICNYANIINIYCENIYKYLISCYITEEFRDEYNERML